MSSRRILANEHLCIDYRGFSEYITTADRRRELQETWGFVCQCERCTHDEITAAAIQEASALTITQLRNRLKNANIWTREVAALIIAYQRKFKALFPAIDS